jgi:hypothetical protein
MGGGIYLIQPDGKLVEMKQESYKSEGVFQDILANYPNLLAGDQIDSQQPRRWLLIAREVGVPAQQDGANHWSLDHLFVDQDGIPTLVEVKRSTDTRIRREVVGQMLDYAANAVVYWPVEEIISQFERTCEAKGSDCEEVLSDFLADSLTAEEFWQKVKTNLRAGHVRMLFVADEIPQELKRIVEFLNEQMDPAEVLAVELRQFVNGELRTLVPRVFGQTAVAEQRKTASGGQKKERVLGIANAGTTKGNILTELLDSKWHTKESLKGCRVRSDDNITWRLTLLKRDSKKAERPFNIEEDGDKVRLAFLSPTNTSASE